MANAAKLSKESWDMPPCPCPYCGHTHDKASLAAEDRPPEPGDFTICIRCGEMCIITERLLLAKPSPDDVIDLLLNADRAFVQDLFTKRAAVKYFKDEVEEAWGHDACRETSYRAE